MRIAITLGLATLLTRSMRRMGMSWLGVVRCFGEMTAMVVPTVLAVHAIGVV